MSGTKMRIVARLGNALDVPALIAGEIGWDADTKAFRIGDDTATPPKVMTTKSSQAYEYPNVASVKFNDILLFADGTVDGITPSLLNAADGFLVRTGDNQFSNRVFETDQYISVTNPDGLAGNPKIALTDQIFELIKNQTGLVNFSFGEDPPVNAKPGNLFWSTTDFLLYIFATQDGTTGAWVDVGSAAGKGGGGLRMYVGGEPPVTAMVGDKWIDTLDEFRKYERTMDEGGYFWKQVDAFA